MINGFALSCSRLIDSITSKINLEKAEVLLWIYLNLYYYQMDSPSEGSYCRESFLMFFLQDPNFKAYYEGYGKIPPDFYRALEEEILKEYCFFPNRGRKTVALKELEGLYERLLQNNIRAKTGTYYTPQYIVEAIVNNSILAFIKGKYPNWEEPIESLLTSKRAIKSEAMALELLEYINKIKIADIACGGGVFLREALGVIYSLKINLYQYLNQSINPIHIMINILANNIYGVDIQPNSAALCKILLLMRVKQLIPGFETNLVKLNIHTGDVLIEDREANLSKKKMDIIIGNPPYIGERGNKKIFDTLKSTEFGAKYYEGKMDYFYFFIYRGFELLKPGGILGFITTNYFVTADGAEKLRSFMKDQITFHYVVNFNEVNIFKDAMGQHNMIFIASSGHKPMEGATLICFNNRRIQEEVIGKVLLDPQPIEGIDVCRYENQGQLFDDRTQLIIQKNRVSFNSLSEILEKNPRRLEASFHINQGIVSGADRLSHRWAESLGLQNLGGSGIFVLTQEEIVAKGLDSGKYRPFLKQFFKNSDIKKYTTLDKKALWILYVDGEQELDEGTYPELFQHLSQYRAVLEERREVKKGFRKWYALQWPRKRELFEAEKIIVPQRALENSFAYDKGSWYASADVYYITPKKHEISLPAMIGILNSSLIYFWLFFRGKRKGEYLELYSTPLKSIPLPAVMNNQQLAQIELLVGNIYQNIENGKDIDAIQREIDEVVYGLYNLSKNVIKEIDGFMKGRQK